MNVRAVTSSIDSMRVTDERFNLIRRNSLRQEVDGSFDELEDFEDRRHAKSECEEYVPSPGLARTRRATHEYVVASCSWLPPGATSGAKALSRGKVDLDFSGMWAMFSCESACHRCSCHMRLSPSHLST